MLRLRIRGQGYLSLLPKGTVGPGPFGLGLSKDVFTGAFSSVQRSWDPVVWKPQRADVVCFERLVQFITKLRRSACKVLFLPFPTSACIKISEVKETPTIIQKLHHHPSPASPNSISVLFA